MIQLSSVVLAGPGIITPMVYGAVGNGTTDDHVALQAAADSGFPIFLDRIYGCGSRITWARNGGGFFSNGTGGINMLTGVGQFTATSVSYGTNGVLIYVDGFDNTVFDNFKITLSGSPSDNNACFGIAILNSSGHQISRLDVSGFKKSRGMIDIENCSACDIINNYVHDAICAGATSGQLTGIAIDDNLGVGQDGSFGLNISGNTVRNLTVDATFLAANGYQTNAILVSNRLSSRHRIIGNNMEICGEGFASFGSYCTIDNNTAYGCYNFSYNFIHGASYNVGKGNTSDFSGIAALIYSGSAAHANDTNGNDMEVLATRCNPIVQSGDPWDDLVTLGTGPWGTPGSAGGAYSVNPPAAIGFATNNTARITVFDSANANWVFHPTATGGNNTWIYRTDYSTATGNVTTASLPSGDSAKNLRPSRVRAYLNAATQAITGSATTIVYDTEVADINSEFDTSTGIFTAKAPMIVDVSAGWLAAGTVLAGEAWVTTLSVSTGGNQTLQRKLKAAANGDLSDRISAAGIRLDTGGTLKIQAQQNKGSDVNITGGSNSTFINIQIMEVG